MKQRIAQSFCDSEFPDERRRQCNHAECFKQCSSADKEFCEADDSADLRCGDCLLHNRALMNSDLFSAEHDHEYPDCHNAKSADLNQNQDDGPAKQRPVGCGIPYDKTGYTGRGSRCKQRIQKRCPNM